MIRLVSSRQALLASSAALALGTGVATPAAADITYFTPGDLVISTVSNSTSLTNAAALDTASPIVLSQFGLSANGTSGIMAQTRLT